MTLSFFLKRLHADPEFHASADKEDARRLRRWLYKIDRTEEDIKKNGKLKNYFHHDFLDFDVIDIYYDYHDADLKRLGGLGNASFLWLKKTTKQHIKRWFYIYKVCDRILFKIDR